MEESQTQAAQALGPPAGSRVSRRGTRGGSKRKLPSHVRRKINLRIMALYLRHRDHLTSTWFQPLLITEYEDEESRRKGEILYRVSWDFTLELRNRIYANNPIEYTPLEVLEVDDEYLKQQGYVKVIWQDSAERPINLLGCPEVLRQCLPEKFGELDDDEIRDLLTQEQLRNDGQALTKEELINASKFDYQGEISRTELCVIADGRETKDMTEEEINELIQEEETRAINIHERHKKAQRE